MRPSAPLILAQLDLRVPKPVSRSQCYGLHVEDPRTRANEPGTWPTYEVDEMNDRSDEPRIVTPQEARLHEREPDRAERQTVRDLAHTVATEPDGTRAAVVKALRDAAACRLRLAESAETVTERTSLLVVARAFEVDADAIENGADW